MIKRVILLSMLVSLSGLAKESSGYQLYSKGVELASQNKCKDATEFFHRAIKLNPSFVSSYIELARCETLLNNRQNGLEVLLKGLAKVKREEDQKKIRKELTNLTEIFYTDNAFQKYQNGLNYLRIGRYNAATEELTSANEKEPVNVLVLLALAKSTELDGNPKSAQEYLEKAVHWNPGKLEALENLAAYIWSTNAERAVSLLEPYRKHHPSERTLTFYSLALTKMKPGKDSLENLRRAVEENNNWIFGAYWLGKSYAEEGSGNWLARKYLMTFEKRVDGVFQNPKDRAPYELEEFKTLKKQADTLLTRVNQALQ